MPIFNQRETCRPQLRPVGRKSDMDLDLARFDDGAKISPQKSKIGAVQPRTSGSSAHPHKLDTGKSLELQHRPRDARDRIADEQKYRRRAGAVAIVGDVGRPDDDLRSPTVTVGSVRLNEV